MMPRPRTPEHTKFLDRIGWLIRQHRKRQGLTMAEAARRIGVHKQSLMQMELGGRHISLYRAHTICQVLGITINDLVYAEPHPGIYRYPSARICKRAEEGLATAKGAQK